MTDIESRMAVALKEVNQSQIVCDFYTKETLQFLRYLLQPPPSDAEVDEAISHAYTIYTLPIDSPMWIDILIKAARNKSPQWQGMESAPRDGTEILIMCTFKSVGQPNRISVVANASWYENDDGIGSWHDIDNEMAQEDVEYWMPMTPPPRRKRTKMCGIY